MLLRKMILGAGRKTGGGDEGPTGIGEPFQGGYYAGKMNYGVPGEDYWLIVAPKSTEASGLQWKTGTTDNVGTFSLFDGQANMALLPGTSHPAANHCRNINVNGFSDWYLPARDEVELLYRNLKPTTNSNFVGTRIADAGGGPEGENTNSIPPGAAYTALSPTMTPVANFQSSGTEAIITGYLWTSSENVVLSSSAIRISTANGGAGQRPKTDVSSNVRAVRRVKIPPTPPGPTELVGGNKAAGFYGEVTSAEFIAGDALATAVGISAIGTPINNSTNWLKFSLNGKIIFVPKLPIRHTINWQQLYQAGLVYGDGTTGLFPAGSPVAQVAEVTVKGVRYAVKLIGGKNTDNAANISVPVIDPPEAATSEIAKLFFPLSTTAIASYTGPKWASYTEADLGFSTLTTMCRESNGGTNRVGHGNARVDRYTANPVTTASAAIVWRPVLEHIE